jgi:diguanylate cyclase (GGDEF)-like protein
MAHAARCAFRHLEEAASVDPLTGLLNRRVFERDLSRELGRVLRHGGTFSVVMLDLDGLKGVNDSLGHAVGDAHLRALGSAMQSCTRSEDSAYRIGGDEFALVLPAAWGEQNDGVMDRLAAAALPARFSWGAASCPADGSSTAAVVAAADARLYERRAAARAGDDSRRLPGRK